MNAPPTHAWTRGPALMMLRGTSATVSSLTQVWKCWWNCWKYFTHPCLSLTQRNDVRRIQYMSSEVHSKTSSGLKVAPPLPLYDMSGHGVGKYFRPFLYIIWQKQIWWNILGQIIFCVLGHFWKICWTFSSKGLLLELGWEQGAWNISCLHTSCLTERQKLNNGRKLELASCKSPVLWKQIGKYFSRLQTLTEPG